MSNHLTASPTRTLPPPPTSAPAAAPPATTAVSSSPSLNGSSDSTISRLNGDRLKSAPAPTSQTLAPSTTNHTGATTTLTETLHPTPVGPPTVIAHALKSLSNFDVALRDKPRPPLYDSSSPYARSLSSTAPGSPRIPPVRQNSGSHTPRVRPHATTLNIPGMTRSRVSPDGRIPDRDVAAKLVIVMVGLPARGKSYITKKIQRYLSWQQHNAQIFNVGNRRRVAAGMPPQQHNGDSNRHLDHESAPLKAASILLKVNSVDAGDMGDPPELDLNSPRAHGQEKASDGHDDQIEQSASFFNPNNESAAKKREKLAMDTLDEVLDYLLCQNGSVGILDATNSTIRRREQVVKRIKEREPKLGILFIESICHDETLLEANMRLKLSGPDYKDKDPVKSLADFKARVKQYESAYVPLGNYEESNDMQYIQMIDVGRKIVQHRLRGFLSGGIASYLTTFNLAPRQIWITRHGQSEDNKLGKLGGDSDLTERGHYYGMALHQFITKKRQEWLVQQKDKIAQSSFPPQPGDHTPPYPELFQELDAKNFCVWTSMLKRSVQTAEYFEEDEDYDVKNWEMLNEMHTGSFEGMTYDEIAAKYPDEYKKRSADKLSYVYPGVGGEGYLRVISRLRDMVREIERITDHVLLISHRSVCRVLIAYFMDLTRDDIADLDMPLGMLYSIEPKPYGYDFHAYKYDEENLTFLEVPDYKPRKSTDRNN
ncbi:6-phosphofructo-2-kinase 1 [Magnaporthiopsis poae ATCC 64411]|uniref:6-phosphofructo-2-kinase 1 n=1 Tax=Magnaporthiopsis poae (strain ATCC 64411 / 73-15) TaxID=644358 RepID=A0A0C4E7Y6_MAGP6|nr:6-phosphofructo-2-kinase 1 [Magnaporthiopsis poae ATCC 64411]